MSDNYQSIIPPDVLKVDSENVYESELMQQCFNLVAVFVAAFDLEGKITMINNKAVEILESDRSGLIGKDFIKSFIVPKKQEDTEKLFTTVFSGRKYPESARYYLVSCTGKKKIIIGSNVTVCNKKDEITGILVSGKDVTDYLQNQKELQSDLKLYRRLANNIPGTGLLVCNEELKLLIAEGNEIKNFGRFSDKLKGKNISDIPDVQIRDLWTEVFRTALTEKTISTEFKVENKYYAIWAFPLRVSGEKSNTAMAIIRNITSDRLKEISLRKSVDDAERENREKSDFIARVTHELRTPLNAVIGFTEQLTQTDLNEIQDEYVKIIDKSSEHMVSLINDVLFLSKIEASEIRFDETPFRIESVIRYVHSALNNKADEKGIIFRYKIEKELDNVIVGDSFRLRQILLNLLHNAIKFTEVGSVDLICSLLEETPEQMHIGIEVKDTGIGIKKENLSKIFEQFKQASSEITNQFGGTGLGLTISKKLIELHKGKISVSSVEKAGTTFFIELPYKKGKEIDLSSSISYEREVPDLQGKKILFVDDDSVNRLLGKIILEKWNCEMQIVNSGEEAISAINEKEFDIVLLDIHMPGIGGLDVAKYIRKKYSGPSPGIIALTAAVMKDDPQSYYRAGINDFLIKPFKESNLYHKIVKILKIEEVQFEKTMQTEGRKMIYEKEKYDISELERMAGGNQEFINKMINTFIRNSEILVAEFRKHLPAKNWEKIGEAAHKVLPSYRHLQVNHIVKLLTEVKTKALIDKDCKKLPELSEITIEEIENLLPELKHEIR